jgi:uncharacterized membrane protein YphA (DoxX/SURF4 family)
MNNKNTYLYFVFAALLFTPTIAEAHVKWFTHLKPEKDSISHILSPLFMGITLFVAILLAILTQLLPALSHWKVAQKVDLKLDLLRPYSFVVLKIGSALALLIQLFSGTLFAPEFEIVSTTETVLMWATIVLLLIPIHWFTKAGALLMLWLMVHLTIKFGIFHMLDYGFYWAIIGVLLLEKTRRSQWAFPFLYLGTGLSLCWVAVEKWVYPAMVLDVVHTHQVPTFGFAPESFVVMAAFIEFVVGYLLVVGILNRLLAVVLTGIFISTTMLFGMTEIVGHFMIHIVLLIFIIEGVSFYKPPISMHQSKLSQMIFVSLNFIFVLSTFVLLYYRFA